MATLERGKGKRKHVVRITRHGSVVRMQLREGDSDRLPGYRVHADAAAATASVAAAVREQLAEGMQAADDEAKAIAEAAPPRRTGPASLPLRQDFAVYNEANGFVVTSRKMAGRVTPHYRCWSPGSRSRRTSRRIGGTSGRG